MSSSEALKRAKKKYSKENTINKTVQLNKNTDNDIIPYIQNLDNFSGYVKDLIRKDIANKKQP